MDTSANDPVESAGSYVVVQRTYSRLAHRGVLGETSAEEPDRIKEHVGRLVMRPPESTYSEIKMADGSSFIFRVGTEAVNNYGYGSGPQKGAPNIYPPTHQVTTVILPAPPELIG